MMPLNCLNSGVSRKRSAVIGGGCVSAAPVSCIWCPSAMCYLPYLPSELLISKPTTDYVPHRKHEALQVVHIPIVVTERLFIDVTEQMKRFNRNVSSVEGSLQETPEVLKTVGVNVTVHVDFSMIDNLLLVLIKPPGREFIRKQVRSLFNVLPKFRSDSPFLAVRDNGSANGSFAFKHPQYHGLTLVIALYLGANPTVRVHVTRLAADEGFIYLYFAAELVECLALRSQPDSMEHKPRRFLRDAKSAVKFPGGYAVLESRSIQTAGNHFSSGIGESSKIVPVFRENLGFGCVA